MFETIPQTLTLLADFAVFGFFAAFFYEIFRIFRMFVRHNVIAAAAEDFLYLSLLGFFTFVYSLEKGGGYFRYFYLLGMVFGGAVYFLTVGRIISIAAGFIAKAFKKICSVIFKYILSPIGRWFGKYLHKISALFVVLHEKLFQSAKKLAKPLQNKRRILYNKRHDVKAKDGEVRHVIKAEIRKKA